MKSYTLEFGLRLFNEALCPERSFSRNAGKCASRVRTTDCSRLAGFRRTKLQSCRLKWSLTASRLFSGMSGQVEWKSEALELGPRLSKEALCPEWSFSRNGVTMG
ncbi:hypothetical protein [Gelidibacter gilvus]|uniref:GON domain-containing protein n=1 Tax=Gelidibacter gilvus TaxID=59602 RepID=A0A4Q0XF73_9FLAO|nr:hypothetical protein [Gelidibacter gilvus]RXJ45724.1 hypothetical protein ESZ48_15120 [Gelidibacter gilvus]